MPQFNPSMSALAAVIIITIWLALRIFHDRSKRRRLPPGPPGWPLMGNIGDFPKEDRWITFSKWAEQYGQSLPHYTNEYTEYSHTR
jgi:hypothetical protein